jgi:KaiC/GvpD/RAD55 family RecA-like ATPase
MYMSVSTGTKTLDEVLGGGLPDGRAVLVTGTPGTGKSTLAMQFLQAGLDTGDEGLFISTEQTIDELHDAFFSFSFDLDHENLTITSLHARTGRTIEGDGDELVIERFEDGEVIGEGFSAAFTSNYIQQVLERYSDADRVVLDSVTGLEPMAQGRDTYRRGVLDLIQLFTDEFGATTVFTSEYVGSSPREQEIEVVSPENTIQYNVYGVLRLWREQKKGVLRRFIDVMKMRGVDHDTRQHEVGFTDEGIEVTPRQRGLPPDELNQSFLSTGIETFDTLLGGGFPQGASVLLEHDGVANIDDLLFSVVNTALNEEMSIGIVPRVNTSPERIDDLIRRGTTDFADTGELLDANRLFVIDALGAWKFHENVFDPRVEDAGLRYLFEQIRDKSAGEGLFLMLNTEAKVHTFGADATRQFRYWVPSAVLNRHTAVEFTTLQPA